MIYVVLRSEDLVRIRSCPKKSVRKHFELDVVLNRGWEGREFDRKNPHRAAPVLTNRAELEAMLKEHDEGQQALDALGLEDPKLLTDATQTTNLIQTPVEGVVQPEAPSVGVSNNVQGNV
jgi:hypothetical protein